MFMPTYLTIDSGFVTPTFALGTGQRGPLFVFVPSLDAGSQVQAQFTETSGSAPFFPLLRSDGTGLVHAVHSGVGPGVGIVPFVPTAWGRLTLTASVTSPKTFTLYRAR